LTQKTQLGAQQFTDLKLRPFTSRSVHQLGSKRSHIHPRFKGHTPFANAVQQRTSGRNSTVAAASSASSVASENKDVTKLVQALHQAAAERSVPPKQVLAAMTQIEKQKLPTDGWAEVLGGDASPGRRWRLIFTTGAKQVQKALKGDEGGASGSYIPINTVQRWDSKTQLIENGIYLGHIASLQFAGPWKMTKRKMDFDFDRINIKLGPWKFGFNLKARQMDEWTRKDEVKGAGPFFLFCYVDDQICVARGRGGGLALWSRTTPVWEAEAGVTQA